MTYFASSPRAYGLPVSIRNSLAVHQDCEFLQIKDQHTVDRCHEGNEGSKVEEPRKALNVNNVKTMSDYVELHPPNLFAYFERNVATHQSSYRPDHEYHERLDCEIHYYEPGIKRIEFSRLSCNL